MKKGFYVTKEFGKILNDLISDANANTAEMVLENKQLKINYLPCFLLTTNYQNIQDLNLRFRNLS